MHLYKDYISHLVPYNQFDPRAFQEDITVSKDLCSFFLALSLVYNDLKTINILINIINEPLPSDAKRREKGELGGIGLHIIRLNVALIYELFNLINKSKNLFNDNYFLSIVKNSEPMIRKCWEDLVFAADENSDFKSSKSNPFFMIRNKILFHYEKDDIWEGYFEGFLKTKDYSNYPCISRGNTILESRLYYADKAVGSYLEKKTNMKQVEFIKKLDKLNKDTLISILNLTTAFIIKRGYPFKRMDN